MCIRDRLLTFPPRAKGNTSPRFACAALPASTTPLPAVSARSRSHTRFCAWRFRLRWAVFCLRVDWSGGMRAERALLGGGFRRWAGRRGAEGLGSSSSSSKVLDSSSSSSSVWYSASAGCAASSSISAASDSSVWKSWLCVAPLVWTAKFAESPGRSNWARGMRGAIFLAWVARA